MSEAKKQPDPEKDKYDRLKEELGYDDENIRALAASFKMKALGAVSAHSEERKLAFLMMEREKRDAKEKKKVFEHLEHWKNELPPEVHRFFAKEVGDSLGSDAYVHLYELLKNSQYNYCTPLIALYEGREIYGNDVEKFKIFVDVAKEGDPLQIKALLEVKDCYGSDGEKLKIFADVLKNRGDVGLKCLSQLRDLYGEDLGKLKKVAEIVVSLGYRAEFQFLLKGMNADGNDLEKFLIFADVVKKHGEEGAKPLAAAKAIYGDDLEKFKLFVSVLRVGKLGIKALVKAKDVYGNDLERLKVFASVVRVGRDIKALVKAKDIYGNDLERLKVFADVVLRGSHFGGGGIKVDTLIEAKDVYGDDLERLKVFADFAINTPGRAVKALVEEKDVYGNDLEKLKIFAEVGKNKGEQAIEQLARAKRVYKDNDEMFKVFVDVAMRGGYDSLVALSYGPAEMSSSMEILKIFAEIAMSGGYYPRLKEVQFLTQVLRAGAYGDDVRKIQVFSHVNKAGGPDAVEVLAAAKNIYGNDLEEMKKVAEVVIDVVKNAGHQALQLLKKANRVYGNDLEKMKQVGDIAKNIVKESGEIAVEVLLGVGEVYDSNIEKFREAAQFFLEIPRLVSDREIDKHVGSGLMEFRKVKPNVLKHYSNVFLTSSIAALNKRFSDNPEALELNEQNWMEILMAYVEIVEDEQEGGNISPELVKKLEELFKTNEAKDFCLKQLEKLWKGYLSGKAIDQPPASMMLLADFVKRAEGAGLLSKFESLAMMVDVYFQAQAKKSTVPRTKQSLYSGVNDLEKRFEKERWSDGDKADFYNISKEIIIASPSLFTDFIDLFQKMNLKDMKQFMETVFPLFNVEIVMIEKVKGHDLKALVDLRRKIRAMKAKLDERSNGKAKEVKADFTQESRELIADVKERFKKRFGIIKTPENFGPEEIRVLINCSLYLSNLSNSAKKFTSLLGLYLALSLNGKWESFRRGEKIDLDEYLDKTVVAEIAKYLEEREKMSAGLWQNLGLSPEDLVKFQEVLQTDEAVIEIGNAETIDVKVANLTTNLRRLEDPDLYPAQMDKDRMKLLAKFGNKKVGAVAAKFYLSLHGKPAQFKDDELAIREQMEGILEENHVPLTAENVKKYFQDEVKPLAIITNVLADLDHLEVEKAIEYLRNLLQPSGEIVAIFQRLGEDFKPGSGATAVNQDLDFLDNLLVKKAESLHENERSLLTTYIGQIREQIVRLEGIYQQIKTKFSGIKSSNHGSELLRTKLEEIGRILNATDTGQLAVTSVMTKNLSLIIENIRECLSCRKKGSNNDTNLTFGDGNKFFIYSQSERQKKGSVADQIVFLEPVSYGNTAAEKQTVVAGSSDVVKPSEAAPEKREMAFVLDRLYGNCTPFILTNHIKTIMKKYKLIKSIYPNIKISILVTNAAITTAGTSPELLSSQLAGLLGPGVTVSKVEGEVDIVQSALADHYVEFNGMGRVPGLSNIQGLRINL